MTGLEAQGIQSGASVAALAGRKAIATTNTRTTTTKTTTVTGLPTAEGMFDPAEGRDSCGVGFVAHIKGAKSHAIVRDALGAYHADVLLTQPGTWYWRWQSGHPSIGVAEGRITVQPSRFTPE